MSVEVEFDEFVRVRSGRLLRTAYALTRDHARAEDLLQTALARCWGAWRRIEGDPEPYVRRSLVNTYNSWWQRRWRDEVPTETLPDQPQDGAQTCIDDRDEVWRALGQLPRQQRTVLVLRYFEDMTEAQVAEALGVSVGTVKSTASKGLARLRTDPGVLEFAMPDVPAGTERVAAVHERVTARRRSRAAMAGAAVAVVLALLAGYAFAHRPDRTHPVRPTPSPSGGYAFPEYLNGYHVLAGREVTLSRAGEVLRYRSDGRKRMLFVSCAVPRLDGDGLTLRIAVGGVVHIGGAVCSTFGSPTGGGVLTELDEGKYATGGEIVITASFGLRDVDPKSPCRPCRSRSG